MSQFTADKYEKFMKRCFLKSIIGDPDNYDPTSLINFINNNSDFIEGIGSNVFNEDDEEYEDVCKNFTKISLILREFVNKSEIDPNFMLNELIITLLKGGDGAIEETEKPFILEDEEDEDLYCAYLAILDLKNNGANIDDVLHHLLPDVNKLNDEITYKKQINIHIKVNILKILIDNLDDYFSNLYPSYENIHPNSSHNINYYKLLISSER